LTFDIFQQEPNVAPQHAKVKKLETGADDNNQKIYASEKFLAIFASLKDQHLVFKYNFNDKTHDREVKLDNGWVIKIGRGFDIYQKPDDWFSIAG
jgi:ATP-dependent Lon protease